MDNIPVPMESRGIQGVQHGRPLFTGGVGPRGGSRAMCGGGGSFVGGDVGIVQGTAVGLLCPTSRSPPEIGFTGQR